MYKGGYEVKGDFVSPEAGYDDYRLQDFRKTCKAFGSRLTVVLRDVNVTRPGSKTYRYAAC